MTDTPGENSVASTGHRDSFEESLEELHQIVTRLEAGSQSLEETIDLFRKGSQLASMCMRQIEDAELRVTELAIETSSDKALAKPLDIK